VAVTAPSRSSKSAATRRSHSMVMEKITATLAVVTVADALHADAKPEVDILGGPAMESQKARINRAAAASARRRVGAGMMHMKIVSAATVIKSSRSINE